MQFLSLQLILHLFSSIFLCHTVFFTKSCYVVQDIMPDQRNSETTPLKLIYTGQISHQRTLRSVLSIDRLCTPLFTSSKKLGKLRRKSENFEETRKIAKKLGKLRRNSESNSVFKITVQRE